MYNANINAILAIIMDEKINSLINETLNMKPNMHNERIILKIM